MIKKLLIFTITLYQEYVSVLLRHILGAGSGCRYSITCSVYTKDMITKYGAAKGTVLALRRILSCQPWSTKHYAIT